VKSIAFLRRDKLLLSDMKEIERKLFAEKSTKVNIKLKDKSFYVHKCQNKIMFNGFKRNFYCGLKFRQLPSS
jgi:hypothetical protein